MRRSKVSVGRSGGVSRFNFNGRRSLWRVLDGNGVGDGSVSEEARGGWCGGKAKSERRKRERGKKGECGREKRRVP